MLKKLTVLAMAVGAVAALALPASASANWKHHGADIQGNVSLGLTGQARFQGGLGGVECQVTSKTTFQPGTTAQVETFVPHPTDATTNCKGLGGLAFCQIHDVTPLGMPWTAHTDAANSRIAVTNGEITSEPTGGFCPVKKIVLSSGNVPVTPNQPNTISSGQLSGSLQASLTTNGGTVDKETVTVSGTVNVESPNANTYSL